MNHYSQAGFILSYCHKSKLAKCLFIHEETTRKSSNYNQRANERQNWTSDTKSEFSAKSRIKTSHSGLRVATNWAICFSIKPLSHDTRFRSDSARIESETVSCSQEVFQQRLSCDKDSRTTSSFTMDKKIHFCSHQSEAPVGPHIWNIVGRTSVDKSGMKTCSVCISNKVIPPSF